MTNFAERFFAFSIGLSCLLGMFLSMSMEEPNEPLACNVDGGRRAGSSRSNDDSSVSMPESGSSGAGSEHGGNGGGNGAPPNGHMAGALPDLHPPPLTSTLKRRPLSPVDDARRPNKRPKHGTSSMLLSLMQVSTSPTHLKGFFFFFFFFFFNKIFINLNFFFFF